MLPVRGATPFCGEPADLFFDFNPCSPCGERLSPGVITTSASTISIHAPRAGSDFFAIMSGYLESHFNPCSPCGERQGHGCGCCCAKDFNPCSPCGERHFESVEGLRCGMHFNPCSPCGERRQNQTKYGLYFGKIAEVSDRQQQRFGMYEVKHERLERLQGHFEKFRGANGRRIF